MLIGALALVSCKGPAREGTDMEYARWFSLEGDRIIVSSPFGGADTLQGPLERLACMSTSYVGFLDALDRADAVVAVSGKRFLENELPQARELGYDNALDYEALLRSGAQAFLCYRVSAVSPTYLSKLKELGIPVLEISEHLESHPLARAEYIKLFGALTGCRSKADSLFSEVRDRYLALAKPSADIKVLVNLPYSDRWYVPGGDNYMTRLFLDAGAQILGAVPGRQESSVISMEQAWEYASEASFWMHPGWCRSRSQIAGIHPLIASFPVLEKGQVWNNTLRETPGGGNAYWETGPVRPDLILEDLVHIFEGDTDRDFNYYERVY